MSDSALVHMSPEDQEAHFLATADALMAKSASDAAFAEDFIVVESSRFEARLSAVDPEPDEEETAPEVKEGNWGSQPTIRDQVVRYPDSVRLVDPETRVFDLSNPEHIAEFNRIQKCAADPMAKTYAITDYERQSFEGKWSVFLTFCKVQYLKL